METRKDSSKRKKRIDIACFIWYTSTGRAIPKMIKYKDEKGTLRVMTNIQVILVEEKNYCGIPSTVVLVYKCGHEKWNNLSYQ